MGSSAEGWSGGTTAFPGEVCVGAADVGAAVVGAADGPVDVGPVGTEGAAAEVPRSGSSKPVAVGSRVSTVRIESRHNRATNETAVKVTGHMSRAAGRVMGRTPRWIGRSTRL